jgi:hypothetical protein
METRGSDKAGAAIKELLKMLLELERLKLLLGFLFGFALLLILGFLCERVAFGKVEEATSYGLLPLIATLSTLSGGFAQWFLTVLGRPRSENRSEKTEDITKQ